VAKKKSKKHTFGSGGLLTGSGFDACVRRLKGKVKDPNAACSSIARNKYGQTALTKASKKGKKKKR